MHAWYGWQIIPWPKADLLVFEEEPLLSKGAVTNFALVRPQVFMNPLDMRLEILLVELHAAQIADDALYAQVHVVDVVVEVVDDAKHLAAVLALVLGSLVLAADVLLQVGLTVLGGIRTQVAHPAPLGLESPPPLDLLLHLPGRHVRLEMAGVLDLGGAGEAALGALVAPGLVLPGHV